MISLKRGDMFGGHYEALVDPVNCIGVHGKGLALAFKRRWPAAVKRFSALCRRGEVVTGTVYNEFVSATSNPQFILFFPTKEHWRAPSEIEWIRDGLEDLIRVVRELKVESLAIPALGCGNGGLDWDVVRPLIEDAARRMQCVRRLDIYEP